MEHRTGHHVHEAPVHDDGGNVVVPVDFPYGEVDELLAAQGNDGPMPPAVSERLTEVEKIRLIQQTLELLCDNATPEQIAQRVVVYHGRLTLRESQTQVAARLGVSQPTLSRLNKALANEFKAFCRILLRS